MLAVRSMKFFPGASVMVGPSPKFSKQKGDRTVSRRRIRSQSDRITFEYEGNASTAARTAPLYFSAPSKTSTADELWPLVEMRAQLVDRGKAHHAFGHLRFDRTV